MCVCVCVCVCVPKGHSTSSSSSSFPVCFLSFFVPYFAFGEEAPPRLPSGYCPCVSVCVRVCVKRERERERESHKEGKRNGQCRWPCALKKANPSRGHSRVIHDNWFLLLVLPRIEAGSIQQPEERTGRRISRSPESQIRCHHGRRPHAAHSWRTLERRWNPTAAMAIAAIARDPIATRFIR